MLMAGPTQEPGPSTGYRAKLKRLLKSANTRSTGSPSSASNPLCSSVASRHLIPLSSVQLQQELGSGEFGVVMAALYTDERKVVHQVAVKCVDIANTSTLMFVKEYELMHRLEHPHIVQLHGVVLDPKGGVMLVTELAPLRSLLECLKEPSLRLTLTLTRLAEFAVQIARGMRYLETERLIHRDLAARNILVFTKDLVKVSDFGLSRALGVGKDYYQTNFNASLKLPIAWCAPECINFLRFTSASDSWAFGVTLWEMFSYGFQPWAALSGQQILEAIDKPLSKRLERPPWAPSDHYAVMTKCWDHEPHLRPDFETLISMLDEARPLQVRALRSASGNTDRDEDLLDFEPNDVITVLERLSDDMWSGCIESSGQFGIFNPAQTVAHLSDLPADNNFSRASLRGSRKKLSREMISGPRGQLVHAAHVGIDGSYFGDVKAIYQRHSNLSRNPSDASEHAPLIRKSTGSCDARQEEEHYSNEDLYSKKGEDTSKKGDLSRSHHRMGYAIGYLRSRNSSNGKNTKQSDESCKLEHSDDKLHEYQTIPNEVEANNKYERRKDAFDNGPLDLGPSLVDEVFQELETSFGAKEDENDHADSHRPLHQEDTNKKSSLRSLVSSTLSTRRHMQPSKSRQHATVKPIKASDEKVLESAIAMANRLASKSLHDLDKRDLDFGFAPVSPSNTKNGSKSISAFSFLTPNSRATNKHFSETLDEKQGVDELITPQVKDAYEQLVESHNTCSSLPPEMATVSVTEGATISNNALPLPPKIGTVLNSSRKRHVRRNPLIIPSQMATNILRRTSLGSDSSNCDAAHERYPQDISQTTQPERAEGQCVVEDSSAEPSEFPFSSSTILSRRGCTITKAVQEYVNDGVGSASISRPKAVNGSSDEYPPANKASDEVRIMQKVLGPEVEVGSCLSALSLTDGKVLQAIKFVRLKKIVCNSNSGDEFDANDQEIMAALLTRDWDLNKAADVLLRRC